MTTIEAIDAVLAAGHRNYACPECRARYGLASNWHRKQACCPGRAELVRRRRELVAVRDEQARDAALAEQQAGAFI